MVRLIVTGVERVRDADGHFRLAALHGINAQRRWRLTVPEALLALKTGRYALEVEFQGERRRAEAVVTEGFEHLAARSPAHGNLFDVLPDVYAQTGA
ncbi:MAG: hypothetical protein ACXWC6_03865 [Ramlibacter sp.]